MESYSLPKITIIGKSGILSKSIIKLLIDRKIDFNLISLSRKNKIKSKIELYKFLDKQLFEKEIGIIINTVASLHPKTDSDKYINKDLPLHLLDYQGNPTWPFQQLLCFYYRHQFFV